MKQLVRSDIKGPALYGPIRDDYRRRVMEIKKPRRIDVGPRVFLVFENRLTLIFQVEEMLRAENLTTDDKIAEELEVYNALMPTDDSLSATLFLVVPQEGDKRAELDRLVGLDEHVILHIGEHAVRADFEAGRSTADRISAVQYTRYPLTAAARAALLTPNTPLRVQIDHPNYRHETECSEATRASLAADYAS